MLINKKRVTQKDVVIKYIQDFGGITSMQAFSDLGVTRLSAVIFDLKKQGYRFDTEDITVTNRYGKSVTYSMYALKTQCDMSMKKCIEV